MINKTNIAHLFFEAAEKYPDHIAIIHNKKAISYKDLENDVLRTAKYFKQKGIQKGDRVLIFVPMSINLYRIVLALFSIGAVAVFLDEWVSKQRMEICCRAAQCKGFIGITKAQIFRWFSKELRQIPIKLKISGFTKMGLNSLSKQNLILNCAFDNTALITFTTGSTGTPKAAKRTHGFLKAQFDALIEKIDPQSTDVDMPVLPIVLLINLGAGATSVITDYKASKPHQFDPGKVVHEIKKHKVNRITSSPFFIKELSKYINARNLKLSGVKKIFTGGAPVFPFDAAIYQKAFPQTDIQIVYGSTEAEPISSISAAELAKDQQNSLEIGLLVGKPYHHAEVKIIAMTENNIQVDSENDLELCQQKEIGEIIVAGPHVLKEYFNNEEALKRNKIFIQDKVYHRTGDSGFLDKSGILYLTGRCSTLFKQNEKYVCPFLLENYFQNLEGVETGTILLINNKTVVVLELNDPSKRTIIENVLNQMALKVDQIIFAPKIPRDPRHNSKIDYDKLRSVIA